MKFKNIKIGKFGFDNSDEKMCEWCDIRNICYKSVLGRNKIKENIDG